MREELGFLPPPCLLKHSYMHSTYFIGSFLRGSRFPTNIAIDGRKGRKGRGLKYESLS